ncbi:hypothetical protein BGZ63DRAFT_352041 [Mariannaea sp. PMI_226]|nr:hypothetical protein BGZ63DRAFT_352041 [Mariannaea sp. PMI_226]
MCIQPNPNEGCFCSNLTSGVDWLGCHFLDPFHTIPIPWNPRVDTLIKHGIKDTWLALAMSDPLLLRATLCMTAAFRASQLATFCPSLRKESLKLKGEAINEVNLAIQEGRITENLLAGIAHLCHQAHLEGSIEEAEIHFQGVRRLITLRGGFQSIKTYQVGRFVNWVDIQMATTHQRSPLYPLNYGFDQHRLPAYITEPCKIPSLLHLHRLGPGYEFLVTVIQMHRQRVLTIKYNMDQTTRDIRALTFSASLLALKYTAINIPTTPEEQCIHIILLALIVFGYTAPRNHHHWLASLPQITTQRLQYALLTGPRYSTTWVKYLPELLWVLFVGAIVDEEDSRQSEMWFLSQLEEIWPLLHYRTRVQLEACLYGMVWDEDFGAFIVEKWCKSHYLL